MLPVAPFALLAAIAIAAGFVASMVGIGGGIFLVPALTLLEFAPTTQVAVGTSLAAVALTSFASTAQYARKRKIDYALGLALMPGLFVGVEIGARLAARVTSRELQLVFAVFLLYPAFRLLTGKRPGDVAPREGARTTAGRMAASLAVGFAAGIASGLLGIGGGAVMVPAMVLAFGLPTITAVATSLFAFGPTSLYGAWRHWTLGNLDLDLALPLALGTAVGAAVGPHLATRVNEIWLRRILGGVLVIAAARLAMG